MLQRGIIATPLTMLLSETSNGSTIHFWRGLDVLAQSDGTNTKYLEYDGLGSVRQLTEPSGIVGLAQTFDPYGNPYVSSGTATTSLGFTGEQTDSNGFVFLRARYYNPSMGRFLNTDPSRQEKNPYLYALDSPTNFPDPSGLITETEAKLPDPDGVDSILQTLRQVYGVNVYRDYGYRLVGDIYTSTPILSCSKWEEGAWEYKEILTLRHAILAMVKVMHLGKFRSAMLNTSIFRARIPVGEEPRSNAVLPGWVYLTDDAFYFYERDAVGNITNVNYDEQYAVVTISHEFGHHWDWMTGLALSDGLAKAVKRYRVCWGFQYTPDFYVEKVVMPSGCQSVPTNEAPNPYARMDAQEDWAESFAAYIAPVNFKTYRDKWYRGYSNQLDSVRWGYVWNAIVALGE